MRQSQRRGFARRRLSRNALARLLPSGASTFRHTTHPEDPEQHTAVPQEMARTITGHWQSVMDRKDTDAEARKRVELAAMAAVMAAERAAGRQPSDVSATRGIGHDIESRNPQDPDEVYFIEVKGRVQGADSVTLTANEIRCANNVPERFRLAIVQVAGETVSAPVFVPGGSYDFGRPGFEMTSSSFPLASLLRKASPSV